MIYFIAYTSTQAHYVAENLFDLQPHEYQIFTKPNQALGVRYDGNKFIEVHSVRFVPNQRQFEVYQELREYIAIALATYSGSPNIWKVYLP